MEPARHSWTNGQFDAGVSPYDPGWQQGLAVFETVGVFAGPDPLPLWSRHLARLARGASVLGLPSSLPPDLRQAAVEVLRRNDGDDVVRIMQTAETWSLTTRSRSVSTRPQVLAVSEFQRHRSDPIANIKSNSYGFHVLARRNAVASGADDALLLDTDGRVLETTTGNLFCELGGALCTPAARGGFLVGVGRDALIDQLLEMSIPVEECDIGLKELESAAAIFTTNAVHGPRTATLGGRPAVPIPEGVAQAWQLATGG